MNNRVLQIRTDALVAEYIYAVKLGKLWYVSIAIVCLTILVPIMFSAAILIAKGTEYESAINTASIILSAVLLSLSVLSLILRLDQKRENFLIARRSNIYVSSEALKLLEKDDTELSWFTTILPRWIHETKKTLEKSPKSLNRKPTAIL